MTAWKVVLTPPGPFGELGAPVVDGQGNLIALVAGTPDDTGAGGFAEFRDTGAIRAVVRAWRDGCSKCC